MAEEKKYYEAGLITVPKKKFYVKECTDVDNIEAKLSTVFEYTKQNGEQGICAVRETKEEALQALKQSFLDKFEYFKKQVEIVKSQIDIIEEAELPDRIMKSCLNCNKYNDCDKRKISQHIPICGDWELWDNLNVIKK